MAGSQPGFSAAEVRTALRFAMTMGMPTDESLQGTFRFRRSDSFASADNQGDPWDWTATPVTTSQDDPVTKPIAVEFVEGTRGQTELGQIDATKVVITILDEDFVDVNGAIEVQFGDNIYDIDFIAPAIGLFDLTVYQIYATARDTRGAVDS